MGRAGSGYASAVNQIKIMKYHPVKTENGWEMADKHGMLEAVGTSQEFKTKRECQAFIDSLREPNPFDELAATERLHD